MMPPRGKSAAESVLDCRRPLCGQKRVAAGRQHANHADGESTRARQNHSATMLRQQAEIARMDGDTLSECVEFAVGERTVRGRDKDGGQVGHGLRAALERMVQKLVGTYFASRSDQTGNVTGRALVVCKQRHVTQGGLGMRDQKTQHGREGVADGCDEAMVEGLGVTGDADGKARVNGGEHQQAESMCRVARRRSCRPADHASCDRGRCLARSRCVGAQWPRPPIPPTRSDLSDACQRGDVVIR